MTVIQVTFIACGRTWLESPSRPFHVCVYVCVCTA